MDIRPPRPSQRPRPTQSPQASQAPEAQPRLNDFQKRPLGPVSRVQASAPEPAPQQPVGMQLDDPKTGLNRPKKRGVKRILLIIISILLVILVAGGVAGALWYQRALSAVGGDDSQLTAVTIQSGSSPSSIANQLEAEGLIRSAYAFRIHTKLNNTENFLQAGSYRLSPGYTTPEIVEHLTNGNTDTFDITFLPGATLADNKKVLLAAGFSEEEVDSAYRATYDTPLFAGKPSNMDLEGYIYPETYRFSSTATVEEILLHSFETYYGVVERNNLVARFDALGMNLYQGITFASIIEKESSAGSDQAQISQVFHSRLAIGMELGSDPTYQYITDKLGVPRDINYDSPYNTRRYPDLPPGPIAVPAEDALIAAANPAQGDYLYFLSGDDDVTYFSRSLSEHEQNIANHCQVKCQLI